MLRASVACAQHEIWSGNFFYHRDRFSLGRRTTSIRRFSTLVGALGFTLMLALGTVASSTLAAESGNKDNVHLCQQGGWANFQSALSLGEPFENQGECVSSGAQNGKIVPASMDLHLVDGLISPDGKVAGAGFEPETAFAINVEYFVGETSHGSGWWYATSDTSGSFLSDPVWLYCIVYPTSVVVSIYENSDIVASKTFDPDCTYGS